MTVLTIAATGSEMDAGRHQQRRYQEKLPYVSPAVLPTVSFLDPTNTFTVPAYPDGPAVPI